MATVLVYTIVARYYDTTGIRKKYQYIQTIEIANINGWDIDLVS